MIVKKHRTWRRWLADVLHVQAHLDREERARARAERDHAFESGLHIGIAIGADKPDNMTLHQYGEMISERATFALPLIRQMIAEQAREVARSTRFEQAMAARADNLAETPLARVLPPEQAPQPEKPPVKSVRQIAQARVPTAQIFPPDSMKPLIGTSHIPAVARGTTGVLLGMHLGKQKAERERTGG